MTRKQEFIVLCGQVVGFGPWETEYSWDGSRLADRESAIAKGFKVRGSDDFNIGVVRGRKLLRLDWMEKTVESDPDELDMIADQISLHEDPLIQSSQFPSNMRGTEK